VADAEAVAGGEAPAGAGADQATSRAAGAPVPVAAPPSQFPLPQFPLPQFPLPLSFQWSQWSQPPEPLPDCPLFPAFPEPAWLEPFLLAWPADSIHRLFQLSR
jgi:hypothetical protein